MAGVLANVAKQRDSQLMQIINRNERSVGPCETTFRLSYKPVPARPSSIGPFLLLSLLNFTRSSSTRYQNRLMENDGLTDGAHSILVMYLQSTVTNVTDYFDMGKDEVCCRMSRTDQGRSTAFVQALSLSRPYHQPIQRTYQQVPSQFVSATRHLP